jgi:hypothetical protein
LSIYAYHLTVRAAVEIVYSHDFVAAFQQFHYSILGRKTGAEADCVRTVFEGSEVFLQDATRGVLGARVLVTFVVAGGGLRVGGGLENGGHHSTAAGIRLNACVDYFSGEFHVKKVR